MKNMSEAQQRIAWLIRRYLSGNSTPEEQGELFRFIRKAKNDEFLREQLRLEWERTGEEAAAQEPDWEKMFSRVIASGEKSFEPEETSTPEKTSAPAEIPVPPEASVRQTLSEPAEAPPVEIPPKTQRRLWSTWKWPAAAAVVLLLAASLIFFRFELPDKFLSQLKPAATEKIAPGGNKAVLVLADGSTVLLDSAANGVLAHQGAISIKKTRDGQLSYVVGGEEGQAPTARGKRSVPGGAKEAPQMNTIRTPRGGQYQIDLPDGSKVWLNAESSLSFPIAFSEGERRVKLRGEAYFEVAHNEAAPFLVSSGNQTVRVLGTRFNINAYDDEAMVKTTLLEGSVKVYASANSQSQLLKPGEAAATDRSGHISIEPTYAEQAIAWKNGKFSFNGEDLQSIMRRLARWYDVQIVYEGGGPAVYFTGSVSRFASVEDVLRKLELTGSVDFSIEERSIIVRHIH